MMAIKNLNKLVVMTYYKCGKEADFQELAPFFAQNNLKIEVINSKFSKNVDSS